MSKEVLPPWAEIQKKTFTNWVNVHLSERGLRIDNLANDFSDGLRLINLLEQISAKRLPKYNKAVKFHNQKLENVGIALKFLKDEGLKLVAIGPEDVVECRIKLILGMIWTIILRWQIQKISYTEGQPETDKGGDSKAELLAWVNSVIPKYPVKNLNKDWQDGKSLAALTNYLRPDSVHVSPLDEQNPLELVTKAVAAAEKLKVPAVISPEDIISPHLDDLSMMTYVSMFRERDAVIKKPDVTKFTAHGAGLKAPVAKKRNKFTVVSRNSEGSRLRTGGLQINSKFSHRIGDGVLHNATVKDTRNGEYTVGYVPKSPGEYLIYVKLHDFDIAGSPFHVEVAEANVISATHSSVDKELREYNGPEKDEGIKKFYFHVTTRHNDGSPATKGGALLVAAILSSDEDAAEIDTVIEDHENGQYHVVFSEPPLGEYTVAIGLPDEEGEGVLTHVQGSPFNFVLLPDGGVELKAAPNATPPKTIIISPKKSLVETHALTKPDGRKYFRVITKDEEGNQAYVPNSNIRAKLSPVDSSKGPYFVISRLNDLVLTIPDNKNTPGEYVLTWTKKTGDSNQLWKISPTGEIENVKTGLILDTGADGTKVVLAHKKGHHEQTWDYNPITEIFASRKPTKSGKEGGLALDIQHAKKQTGAGIVLFAKRHQNNNKSQRWYLVSQNKSAQLAPPPAVASFYIASRLNGLVLGTKENKKDPGSDVVLVPKKPVSDDSHAHQLWKFTPDGFVQNVATGLVLDIEGDGDSGTKVILWKKKPKDNTNQKWKYSPETEILASDKAGLILEVQGAHTGPGTNAIIDHPKEGKVPSQHWYLVPHGKGHTADVPNVSSSVPVEIEDHQDGTYDVLFLPEVAGKYDVSVGLAPEDESAEEGAEQPVQHFENSPFVANIDPAADVSPIHSTISPSPIVRPNGDRVFEIKLKDKEGHKIPYGSVPLVAHVTAKPLHNHHGKEKPVPVSVVDLGDGAYELVVKPTEGTGLYNVDVGLPAEGTQQIAPHSHLGSAPLEVKIDLGDDVDPSRSTVDRDPLSRPVDDELLESYRLAKRPKKTDDDLPTESGKYVDLGDDDDDDDDVEPHHHGKDHPDKRKRRGKKARGLPAAAGTKPPVVKRVWKARARDAEGNPLLHGGAPVVAKAIDKHGDPLPTSVEDNHDGTYDVVVAVPVHEDDDDTPVTVHVGLSNDLGSAPPGEETISVPFHGTPFTQKVNTNDSEVVPEAVLELIPTPKFAKSGTPYFVIHSRDKAGHPLKRGGLPIVAKLANLEDVPENLEGVLEALSDHDNKEALELALANTSSLPVKIKDKEDGTYRLYFEEPLSGDFILDLGLGRHGGGGSAFPEEIVDRAPDLPIVLSVDVGDSDILGDLDITKSEADLSKLGEDVLPDGSIYFPVFTKDSGGEPISIGGAPIGAAVSVADRHGDIAVPSKVVDNGDGTYTVGFVPEKLPGVYTIAVGLEEDGELIKTEDGQIKDFPILVQLGPGIYDSSIPLAQAAEGLLADLASLGHKPEDGEGGYGFDVVPNPKKSDAPNLEDIGAALTAQVLDDKLNEIPVKVHDKPDGSKRVSFRPKHNHPHPYTVGVAVTDPEKNAAEIPGSPFKVAVGPDGSIAPVASGSPVDDEGLPVHKGHSGDEPEVELLASPFDLTSSPYHELPLRPEYAKVIEVPSVDNTTVDGPGLHKAIPDEPSTFYIHPKSSHGHPVSPVPALARVKLLDPNGHEVRVKLAPTPDGSIAATYVPKVAGPHKLEVAVADAKGAYHPVHGTPFEVNVLSAISASHSKLVGPGITEHDVVITTKSPSYFTIHTFDHEGKPAEKGGAKFEVNIKPPSLLSAVIALFVHPEIIDNHDGTYTVKYEPRDGGKHTITVTLNGEHVGVSPVEVEVEEGTDEGESIAVDYMFTIEARDKNGVPRHRGGDKFEVSITGPEGPVENVLVEDLSATSSPGKYRVFYTLPGKGKYTIKATLNGKDIKGSPWKQKL